MAREQAVAGFFPVRAHTESILIRPVLHRLIGKFRSIRPRSFYWLKLLDLQWGFAAGIRWMAVAGPAADRGA